MADNDHLTALKTQVSMIEHDIRSKGEATNKRLDKLEDKVDKVVIENAESRQLFSQIMSTLREMKEEKRDNKSIWIPTIVCLIIGIATIWVSLKEPPSEPTPIQIIVDEKILNEARK